MQVYINHGLVHDAIIMYILYINCILKRNYYRLSSISIAVRITSSFLKNTGRFNLNLFVKLSNHSDVKLFKLSDF